MTLTEIKALLNKMADPQYITVREASRRLALSPRTIMRYMDEGRLTRFKVRGQKAVRLLETDVHNLMQPVPLRAPGSSRRLKGPTSIPGGEN